MHVGYFLHTMQMPPIGAETGTPGTGRQQIGPLRKCGTFSEGKQEIQFSVREIRQKFMHATQPFRACSPRNAVSQAPEEVFQIGMTESDFVNERCG